MNSLDVFLTIFIAYFTIRGIFRGLIKELIIVFALVLGYMVAFTFFEPFTQWLLHNFKSFPKTGARIIAFAIIFFAINIGLRILGIFVEKLIKFAFLQPLNRLGGGLFGLVKSLFFLSIIVFILRLLPFANVVLQKIGAGKSVLWPYVIYFSTYIYQILLMIIPGNAIQQQIQNLFHSADSTLFNVLKIR